eukprot:GHVN01074102.1.p1 GENE.GHVN01074102.1~~GHVN01074102.1.p1  ORF type:complete len:197 (+),score=2.38 GHVN01074102.1:64-654(+)
MSTRPSVRRNFGSKNPDELQTEIQHGFIRQVFGIVAVQLAITSAIVALTLFVSAVRNIVLSEMVTWIARLGSLSFVFTITFRKNLVTKFPSGHLILLGYTLCNAVFVANTCFVYARLDGIQIVALALALTTAGVCGLVAFASQTKYSFLSWIGVLSNLSFYLSLFLLAKLFFSVNPQLEYPTRHHDPGPLLWLPCH